MSHNITGGVWLTTEEDPDGGGTGCDCGKTDTFDRTTFSPNLGTADCGLAYGGALVGSATARVDGSAAVITLAQSGIGPASFASATATLTPVPTLWDPAADHSVQFSLDVIGDAAIPDAEKIEFHLALTNQTLRVVIIPSATSLWQQGGGATPTASASSQITWAGDLASGTVIPTSFWVPGRVYTVGILTDGSNRVGYIEYGATRYETTLGSVPTEINQVTFVARRDIASPISSAVVQTVTVDELDVPEVTRCSQFVFDDFHRTASGEWGDPWTGSTSSASVHSTYGQLEIAAFTNDAVFATTGGWQTPSGFVMETAFLVSDVPGAGAYFKLEFDAGFDFTMAMYITSDLAFSGFELFTSAEYDFVSLPAWTDFTLYAVRLEYIPGQLMRARVWPFGTEWDGTWDLTVVDAAAPVLADEWVVFAVNQSAIDIQMRMFVVDFDYEGEPCYFDCGYLDGEYEVFDNFNRTVAPNSWGTPSGGTANWTRSATQGTSSVNGSQGELSVISNATVRSEGHANTLGFSPIRPPFVIAFDLDSLVAGGTYGGSDTARFIVSLQDGFAFPNQLWLDFEPYRRIGAAAPVSYVSTNATDTNPVTGSPITSGTVYIVGEADGVTIIDGTGTVVIAKTPWRAFGGSAMDVTGRSINFMDYDVLVTENPATSDLTLSVSIGEIRIKDSDRWGVYCSPIVGETGDPEPVETIAVGGSVVPNLS